MTRVEVSGLPPWSTWCLASIRTFARTSHAPANQQVQTITINPLTPNDHYSGHTAPLTSKRCILYIYSTNTDFIHILYTGCAKIKKIIPAPKV